MTKHDQIRLPWAWAGAWAVAASLSPALAAHSLQATTIPCPAGVPAGEIEGQTVQCGVVAVPEDHRRAAGRQIELTYAVFKSRSLAPQPDPLIVLHGGPAQNAIPKLDYYMPLIQRQRQSRDVILFDQRGSAHSGELGCAPSSFALDEVIKAGDGPWAARYAALRERLRSPADPDDEFLVPTYVCGQVLKAHGVDLNQYRTTASAHDVVNLATALGYQRVNLYGFSYGTYLAQRVMRDHPKRLRSVVLDSTLPQHLRRDEVTVGFAETALLNLTDDCQQDTACRAAYPDLKARTIALVNALAARPLQPPAGSADEPVQAEDITSLVLKMNGDPRIAPLVPRAIAELERGRTTTLFGLKTGAIFTSPAVTLPPPAGPGAMLRKASELRAEARKLLADQTRLSEVQRPSQQWVQQVLDAIEALPEPGRMVAKANFHGVGYQAGLPRDRAALQTLVTESLPDARATLLPTLQAMNETEVRHVYEVIAGIQHRLSPLDGAVAMGAYRSIECSDFIPASTAAGVEAAYGKLAMPALARMNITAARQARAVCALWPVQPAPASDHALLRSAVPTLVLQGRYDMQTADRSGRRVLEGLRKAHWVEFPNSGHGVFLHSACARDVAAAFVENPGQAPESGCTRAMTPRFEPPSP